MRVFGFSAVARRQKSQIVFALVAALSFIEVPGLYRQGRPIGRASKRQADKTSFMIVPAITGPEIVKLERLEKSSFMTVPVVGGTEIVKLECPGKSNFMIVPSVWGA